MKHCDTRIAVMPALCGQALFARILRSRGEVVYSAALMKKSVHSDEYRIVRETLISMRRSAGLKQADISSLDKCLIVCFSPALGKYRVRDLAKVRRPAFLISLTGHVLCDLERSGRENLVLL